MIHNWDLVTFLHWRYEPAAVQALLPEGLEIEEFDGSAWVGLVPFRMTVRLPGAPPVPWLSRFPETNVRTYVRGPDGRAGIFFLSLEASRLPAVVTARSRFGLPYMWARMSLRQDGDHLEYESSRVWPGPRGASLLARVRVGEPFEGAEPSGLDDFLVSRFRLYSERNGRLLTVAADHQPWPLRHAHVPQLHDELMAAAGLPASEGDPLVHYSDGVEVRIGRPERLG
jgi:uncharacterized protein YqjF (DUF2071 family)